MRISLQVSDGFLSLVGGGIDHRRPLIADALFDIGGRYAFARGGSHASALLEIGRALYDWLDGAEAWLAELRRQLTPPFLFEIQAPLHPTIPEWAVLHAPWEVLADRDGFLAEDVQLRYAPARRLGKPVPLSALDDYRLGVAFMAAAPRGAQSLDFEAEEAAIMTAAGGDLDLLVEESGDPEELGRRLCKLKPTLPVLHLSCHGHNAWRGKDGNQAPRPVLIMEHAASGDARPTTADGLVEALGAYQPRLLFLSACLTASAGETRKSSLPSAESGVFSAELKEEIASSLAAQLARHLPAIVGWDGSVADVAATAFARELYDDLGKKQPLALAAASARRALMTGASGAEGYKGTLPGDQLAKRLLAEAEALKRDWHLARVWLGSEGGGPIAGGDFQRSLIPPDAGTKHLLAVKRGERLEVADASVFVGRRRELKQALRILAGGDKAALLLHGMGRLGKSSLAGQIINRRPDLTQAVVFAAYDALSVVDALAKALEAHEPAAKLIAERRSLVRDDPAALKPLLVQLLSGPCKWTNDGGKPLLLLVDDLERVLEADPAGGRHRVRSDVRAVLSALLHAFTPQRTHSRLVLTSRFRFALVEDGRDLAADLADLELSEFSDTSRRKLKMRQIMAARAPQDGSGLDEAGLKGRLPLLEQAQALARGNPGLQDLLGSKFVLRRAVPPERAQAVLVEMVSYLRNGELPKTEEVRTFLQSLAIDALLDLAGPSSRDLLRAMTLFELPVPEASMEAFAELGGDADRLRDLGLLTPAEDVVTGKLALAVSALAANRLTSLTATEQATLAKLVLPVLFALWRGADRRPYRADIELTRLALLVGDVRVLKSCAEQAVRGLHTDGEPAVAGNLGQAVVAAIEAAGDRPSLRLLSWTAEALQTSGEGTRADAVLAKGATQAAADIEPEHLDELSNFLFAQGNRERRTGDVDAAMDTFKRLCEIEMRRANPHQLAVARGQISNLLFFRGELNAGLRILTDEVLPVFHQLRDYRSFAVTQGKIADILEARGDLAEALRIRIEEQLPIFERLGIDREAAIAHGRIADILERLDKPDEALRIRIEEQLPVLRQLDDAREIATAQNRIGSLLTTLGKPAEALALHKEALATCIHLGDKEGISLSLFEIAKIELQQKMVEDGCLHFAEAWSLVVEIGGRVGIATVGQAFGLLLAEIGMFDEARSVLGQAAEAYRQIGRVDRAARIEAMIADINKRQS